MKSILILAVLAIMASLTMACSRPWTVKAGDTCWDISAACGISLQTLYNLNSVLANGANCGGLQIGQVLCCAAGTTTGGGNFQWNTESNCEWALGCDFRGTDIHSQAAQGSQCSSLCAARSGCTNFAWNGGTCWMKSGSLPKSAAFAINSPGAVCGVMTGGSTGSGSGLVTESQFSSAVTVNGYPNPSNEQYKNLVSQAGPKGNIYNKRELAMFLAQILWESDGLRAKREYACVNTGCPGQYWSGVGVPGQNYFGRGYIQLSWDYNYRQASQEMFGDDRLLRDPDMVARDDSIAWGTAFWFWKKNVHNRPGVQQGHFGASTNAINGFLECQGAHQDAARKRFVIYGKVLRAFGVSEAPIETGCYN